MSRLNKNRMRRRADPDQGLRLTVSIADCERQQLIRQSESQADIYRFISDSISPDASSELLRQPHCVDFFLSLGETANLIQSNLTQGIHITRQHNHRCCQHNPDLQLNCRLQLANLADDLPEGEESRMRLWGCHRASLLLARWRTPPVTSRRENQTIPALAFAFGNSGRVQDHQGVVEPLHGLVAQSPRDLRPILQLQFEQPSNSSGLGKLPGSRMTKRRQPAHVN